MAPPQATAQCA